MMTNKEPFEDMIEQMIKHLDTIGNQNPALAAVLGIVAVSVAKGKINDLATFMSYFAAKEILESGFEVASKKN